MGVRASAVEPIGAACRRAVGTRFRKVLAGVTLGSALAVAAALGVTLSPQERTFLTVSSVTQSILSIFVPFFGVLLTSDLRRRALSSKRVSPVPSQLAAVLVAVVVAGYGLVVGALAVGIGPPPAGVDPWRSVLLIGAGSLIMQVLAALVGTGFGLAFRSPLLAGLATIVVPLGLWLLLGVSRSVSPLRDWTTPYAAVQHLFTGHLSALNWLQWLIVMAVWGLGLNALGSTRLARPPTNGP